MRLEDLSSQDLELLAAGNVEGLSDSALQALAGEPMVPLEPETPGVLPTALDTARRAGLIAAAPFIGGSRDLAGQALRAEREGAQAMGAAGAAVSRAAEAAETAAPGLLGPAPAALSKLILPQDEGSAQAALLAGPVGKVAAKAFEPLGTVAIKAGGKISEGAKALVAFAESRGLKLSPADITKSKFIAQLESLLEKTPFGSEAVHRFRQSQVKALSQLRDSLMEKFGTREDASVLGDIAQRSIAENQAARKVQKDALYGRVAQLTTGKDFPAENLRQAALQLLEKEMKAPPKFRSKEIMDLTSDILGIEVQAGKMAPEVMVGLKKPQTAIRYNFDGVRAIQDRLNEVIEGQIGLPGQRGFASSKVAGAAKLLRKASELDLRDFSKLAGPEAMKAYDVAKAFYKEGVETFDNKTVRRLAKAAPEKVVDIVFSPGAVTQIQAVKRATGEAGFTALKKQFVEKVLPEVQEESFKPGSFSKALSKYGDEVLSEVFTPKELMQIRSMDRLAGEVLTAERLAGNPSGTARTVLGGATWAQVGGLILSGFSGGVAGAAGTAGIVLGPKVIADFYLSEAGRRLLVQGFKTSIDSPKAAKVAASISTFLAGKGVTLPKQKPEGKR